MKNISIFEAMRFIFKIVDFIVVSNLYVAAGTFSLSWLTFQFYGSDNLVYPLFVFFSTLFAYNFMRLVRVKPMLEEGDSSRHKNIYRYRAYLWATCLLAAFTALFFFLQVDAIILNTLIVMGVISIAYSLPLYKNNGQWLRLRDLPFIKIFLIALVWTVVSTIIPMQIVQVPINWLKVLERFCFVLAITIPFDIRDLKFDSSELYTLPQVLGIKKSKYLGVSLLLVAEMILFYEYYFLNLYNLAGALAIYIAYEFAAVLVYKADTSFSERYFTVGVEGTSLLIALLFYLSQKLL